MNAVLTNNASTDIGIDNECPICAHLCDPVTKNPRFNSETLAAFEETKAIMRGEIPAKRYKPHEFEEVWSKLLED
ncbi:MAG: hypothetical protein FWD47_14300 [Treponema sp.]|nr:hypothetical protein [Treponema sp.]